MPRRLTKMGKMNLLKAKYDGKVGQTVGAKWKNKSTIRTYSTPANPKTEAQTSVRSAFKSLTSYIALFADQIKYLNALNTSGMSVRNALIKLNKSMIDSGTVTVTNLQISKGGLQKPLGFTASKDESANTIKVSWTAPTATNFTSDAQMVIVAVDEEQQIVDVFTAKADAAEATGTVSFANATDIQVFGYYLDKRASAKVASVSVESTIA